VHLKLAASVDDIDKAGSALVPACRQAAGDPVLRVGLLTALERVVGGVDVADRRYAVEFVREGVDALRTQALELGPTVVEGRGVVHAPGGY
jgi:hypothetical protein